MQIIELTDEERQALRERAVEARDACVEMTGDEGQQIPDAPVAGIEAAEQEAGANQASRASRSAAEAPRAAAVAPAMSRGRPAP